MERAVCERCGHRQPRDWAAGDLCVACGAAVRREVRCAWCAEWIPAGRFCRGCGCDVVRAELYGPARMLKSAGVDRFSLAQRLLDLDPEQIANLGRIYNAQLAVVERRVEEVRLCESCLLQKEFSKRLEEDLVPRLPMEKEDLAALASGPEGPFDERPELLVEIAQRSPIETSRMLAWIALLRQGHCEGAFTGARLALESSLPELALEAALAFAHWRVRLCPQRLHSRLLAGAGSVPRGSPLRSWAAAAVALARWGDYGTVPETGPEDDDLDWLRDALCQGLTSRDSDLRFTCAMALGEYEIVSRALESDDEQQRVVARRFLARHKSPAIARYLIEGPDEVRQEVLEALRDPLPDALVEPVLCAAEQGGPDIRCIAVWRLLLPRLTEAIVDRLVRLARRENDSEVFRALAGCERLPANRNVVRAIIEAGLFDQLCWSLRAEHVEYDDEAVLRLAREGDAQVLGTLVSIAGNQLAQRPLVATARFLAGVAFGSAPAGLRWAAYSELDNRIPDWMSRSTELFASPAQFAKAISVALRQPEPEAISRSLLSKLSSAWEELGETFAADQAIFKQLLTTLGEVARGEFYDDIDFHDQAARLLVKAAMVAPAVGLPVVTSLLRDSGSSWPCRNVPHDLLAHYETIARCIAGDPRLAAELCDALAALIAGGACVEHIPAIQLLTRLAQDHAGLRPGIATGMAAVLQDRDSGGPDLKASLDELAQAVEWQDAPENVPEEQDQVEIKEPPAMLDHVVVFPGQPLPTLAQYVAFMKAMGAASDPRSVLASYGLTELSFGECVSRWGEVLGASDEFALRYSRLIAP